MEYPMNEIAPGELIGWRTWTVKATLHPRFRIRGSPALHSISHNYVWVPGTNSAESPRAAAKIETCPCCGQLIPPKDEQKANTRGFYSLKSEDDLIDYIGSLLNHSGAALIFGTIHIWGTVVEGEKGYRSQFAAVRSLDFGYDYKTETKTMPRSLPALRQAYGLDLASSCRNH